MFKRLIKIIVNILSFRFAGYFDAVEQMDEENTRRIQQQR
jgi:hypothetical protein